jgi:hypothetical protein
MVPPFISQKGPYRPAHVQPLTRAQLPYLLPTWAPGRCALGPNWAALKMPMPIIAHEGPKWEACNLQSKWLPIYNPTGPLIFKPHGCPCITQTGPSRATRFQPLPSCNPTCPPFTQVGPRWACWLGCYTPLPTNRSMVAIAHIKWD